MIFANSIQIKNIIRLPGKYAFLFQCIYVTQGENYTKLYQQIPVRQSVHTKENWYFFITSPRTPQQVSIVFM